MIGSFKYGWFTLKTTAPTSLLYTKANTYSSYVNIGASSNDYFGRSVSINGDGTKIAVCSPNANGARGAIFFYNKFSSTYFVSGALSSMVDVKYYNLVCLDETGLSGVAVWGFSAPQRLIKFKNSSLTNWTTLGTLTAPILNLKCDKTSNIIVYSHPTSAMGGTNRGYARIIEWDGVNAVKEIGNFVGTDDQQILGYGIAISKDGNTIAIASPYSSSTTTKLGCVSTFKWDGTNLIKTYTLWGSQMGQVFGGRIALNGDGTIMAVASMNEIAANGSRGVVRVYEWYGSNWNQKGNAFYGKSTTVTSWPNHLDMNSSGNIIAAGYTVDSMGGFTQNGSVQIYQWDGSNWVNVIPVLSGGSSSDNMGTIDLNAMGNVLVVGVEGYDAGGLTQRGLARVYDLTT